METTKETNKEKRKKLRLVVSFNKEKRKKQGLVLSFIKEIRKNKYLYTLALPGFIFIIIFSYIPMSGYLIAFKKYQMSKGLLGSPWVGFNNFKFFFGGQDWLRVTGTTLFLNSLFILLGLSTAIIIAVFLNEIRNVIFKRISQSIIFLPYFISWLVVSLMIYALFNSSEGLVNRILLSLGKEGINWYTTPQAWPGILTLTSVWKSAGYNSIIFLAAITGISGEYYESAKIDGATRLQQIRSITIPLMMPTVIVLALLAVGRIFYGDFGMIYGIVGDNGILFPTTDVIDTYSFRALRQLGNFSMSSAITLYQSAVGLVTILIFNWITNKIDKESSLF